MIEAPGDLRTVIKRRRNTINFLMLANLFTIGILTIIFLGVFGIDLRVQHFVFSYRLAFLFLTIVLQFILVQRLIMVLALVYFKVSGNEVKREKPEKVFGKYLAREIWQMVDNQCKKMKVKSVKNVFVLKAKTPNAMTMDIILFSPFRYSIIILYSNTLRIMKEDELEAIIGHEVAHVRNYDSWHLNSVGNPVLMMIWVILIWITTLPYGISFPPVLTLVIIIVIIFYIIIRPLVKRMMRYFEYFADFTSARFNGIIPVTNALIKLGQRNDTLVAFQYEFQKRFRVDWKLSFSSKFYKKLEEELKDVIDPDEAIEVAREIVKEYGGIEKEVKDDEKDGTSFLKPKVIDWREYDNHIQDYSLDYIELEQLVKDLKDSPQARLFEHASTSKFLSLFQTHPRYRERIIFLWDSKKEKYERTIHEVPIFAGYKEIEKMINKNYKCPICQAEFRLRKDPDADSEISCPGCGIKGEI